MMIAMAETMSPEPIKIQAIKRLNAKTLFWPSITSPFAHRSHTGCRTLHSEIDT